jgi:hypothetical protein
MKNKNLSLVMLCALFLFVGCNKDDDKISIEQTRQALFDMKAKYYGDLSASFVNEPTNMAVFKNFSVSSADSLIFMMPLDPIADAIADKEISKSLKEIGEERIAASYEFLQIDDNGRFVHFVLIPKNIKLEIKSTGDTKTKIITILLSDNYGGNFSKYATSSSLIFNVSPNEIIVDGVKIEDFKPMVYHYEGTSE